MKATGIVRKLDHLNRFVVPRELTKTLNFENNQPLEVFVDGQDIILRKYAPGCEFCGDAEGVISFKGHSVCPKCISDLKAGNVAIATTHLEAQQL